MPRPPRFAAILAALALAGAAVVATSPGAEAHGRTHHDAVPITLADGLVSPLSFALAPDGTAYVAENFASQLLKIRPGHDPQVVYTNPDGYEVGGVSVDGHRVLFTLTRSNPDTMTNTGTWLMQLGSHGHATQLADIYTHEASENPDQVNTYGITDLDAACAAQWPTNDFGPVTYTGQVDSHAYSTYARGPWTYIGDAGANAIFVVTPWHTVRTVAVLPPIPYVITADAASGLGLPDCVVGHTYYFEPVPTDVEPAHHGKLYVSSLPGGPEGPQLGARGSVFTVDPRTGSTHQVVTGFLGATGLAVGRDRTLYVANLFGNAISKVRFGWHGPQVTTFATPNMPAALETRCGRLYATIDALVGADGTTPPDGKLVMYR